MQEKIYGSLHDSNEIKLLILFIIKNFGEPIAPEQLNEIVMLGQSANYFDLNDKFLQLFETGQIVKEDDGRCTLSPLGTETIDLLFNRLPFTVRNRAINNATKVLIRMREQQDTPCTITEEDGGVVFSCAALENGRPMFEVKVVVDTKIQAELMKSNYKRDPYKLFRAVIDVLSEE